MKVEEEIFQQKNGRNKVANVANHHKNLCLFRNNYQTNSETMFGKKIESLTAFFSSHTVKVNHKNF